MIPDRVGWDLRHKADMGTQPGPCNLREGHREQPRKESGLGERPGIKGQGKGRRASSPREGKGAGRAQFVFARIQSCPLMDSKGGRHALLAAWEFSCTGEKTVLKPLIQETYL